MLPVGAATEALETGGRRRRPRGRPEAPDGAVLALLRAHALAAVGQLGDAREVDAHRRRARSAASWTRSRTRTRASEPFEDLLYAEVDAVAEEVLDAATRPTRCPRAGSRSATRACRRRSTIADAHGALAAPGGRRPRAAAGCARRPRDRHRARRLATVLPTVAGRDDRPHRRLCTGCRRHRPRSPSCAARGFTSDLRRPACPGAAVPAPPWRRDPVDLHLVEYGGALWNDALTLREHLRRQREAQRWAEVKRAAARTRPARHAALLRPAPADARGAARRRAAARRARGRRPAAA